MAWILSPPPGLRASSFSISHLTCSLSPTSSPRIPEISLDQKHSSNSKPLTTGDIANYLISAGVLDASDLQLFTMLTPSRATRFSEVLNHRTRHVSFVLDGVHGAHNLAAIARSCDAWGIQDLHIISQPTCYNVTKVDGDNPRKEMTILQRFRKDPSVKNVSKNCHKWLSIHEHESYVECVKQLRAQGYRIIVSSLDENAMPIHDIDLSEKCAFVFGNEKHGVRKELVEMADGLFTVPMMGFVESMNVSVAVATTACLTVTKCQERLPADVYFLSRDERKQLAKGWLKERFQSKRGPRLLHTNRDVTRLGYKCERHVVRNGMFATVEPSLPSRDFWRLKLRLCGDGGKRLAKDFTRRKVGALSDTGFENRAKAISLFIAGSHALSCEAALVPSGSLVVTRQTLKKYFEQVCDNITALYRPQFDQFGVPSVPIQVMELHKPIIELERIAPRQCTSACFSIANDLFGFGQKEVESIVNEANIGDIIECIIDTIREGKDRAAELQDVATSADQEFFSFADVLMERYRERTWDFEPLCTVHHDITPKLHPKQREVLHAILRITNAAMQCSEIYQALWDRHIHKPGRVRIHFSTFTLLEMLLEDSFSEMVLMGTSHEVAMYRVIFEWKQALLRAKSYFSDQ